MGTPVAQEVRVWSRRSFIRSLGLLTSSALLAPERLLAEPGRALRERGRVPGPVRIRGRVHTGGRGLGAVSVTDGFDVVGTDSDGTFELVARNHGGFVSVSVPRGYGIPTSTRGTAEFYRPIVPGPDGAMDTEFALLPLAGSDDRHATLLLPDIQTEFPFEMERFHSECVPDLLRTVSELGDLPVTGISCGDIMFDDLGLYPEYERGIGQVGIPFFQCVGNHDLDLVDGPDEASTRTFTARFGPRYYSFDRGEIHYVVLDDVLWHGAGYIGYLGYEQLHWLESDLARVEPGATVVVATHIPVQGSRYLRDGERSPGVSVSINNRAILYRLLEPFEAHVVAGHTHENDHIWADGIHEHVSGTVCGAWWSGDICGDGTPNGYSIYEAVGSELRWRYKATGALSGHQMRLYPRGSDPRAPGEIVANVWDADEEWVVTWFEGGDRRGGMSRRVGIDPRARLKHTGSDLPEHRSWVEPYPTRHLFYAPVDPDHGPIRVEAVDRFGRTYTEELRAGAPLPG
jgi:hypothetical protein